MLAKFLFNVILKTVNQIYLRHATTSLKTTVTDTGIAFVNLLKVFLVWIEKLVY